MGKEFRISSLSGESSHDAEAGERSSEIRMRRIGDIAHEKEMSAEESAEHLLEKATSMARVLAKMFETSTNVPKSENAAQRFRKAALNLEGDQGFIRIFLNLPKLLDQMKSGELPKDEESLQNLYSVAENLSQLSKPQPGSPEGKEESAAEHVADVLQERKNAFVNRANARLHELAEKAKQPHAGDLAAHLEQLEQDDAEATEMAKDIATAKNLPAELEELGKLSETVQHKIMKRLASMDRAA